MTTTDDEATRLFVTAEEEDAERESVMGISCSPTEEKYYFQEVGEEISVVVAPGMPEWEDRLCGTGHSAETGREATESGLGHSPLLLLRDADLPRSACGHRRRWRYQGQDGCLCCDLEAQRGRVTV